MESPVDDDIIILSESELPALPKRLPLILPPTLTTTTATEHIGDKAELLSHLNFTFPK